MNHFEAAEIILRKDYIKNYCIMEMLKASAHYDIDILNESVFVRLKGTESFIMLSAPDRNDGEALLKRNLRADDKGFYTNDYWPMISEGKTVSYHSDCVQLYIPETVNFDSDEEGIIELTCDQAHFIHENYDHKHIISEKYIEERIKTGPAVGIQDNGALAGWVMTHEEGTMGVMTVLPDYRRKGYAEKLNAALVKRLRALGKPCIVHIIKGNTPSLTLANKSGMVYSCDVHWMFLE